MACCESTLRRIWIGQLETLLKHPRDKKVSVACLLKCRGFIGVYLLSKLDRFFLPGGCGEFSCSSGGTFCKVWG